MTKEEASIKKKTNLEITIEALREVEQLKNTPNKKSNLQAILFSYLF